MTILEQVRAHGAELDQLKKTGTDPEALALKCDEYINAQMDAIERITRLPDTRDQLALIGYYCCGMSIAALAAEMGLSWKQTSRILKAAAGKFEKGE